MRLTDDRYDRQRFRLEVALRMIRHQARTSTILACTGISEDRVRKLYRSYFGGAASGTPRKRGKSPRQSHCLTHNLRARMDASLFASIAYTCGVVEIIRSQSNHGIDAGIASALCDAYELFRALRGSDTEVEFSFEHAWYLIRALIAGEELAAEKCPRCTGLTLRDLYAVELPECPLCEIKRSAQPRAGRRRIKSTGAKPATNDYISTDAHRLR